MHRVRHHSDDSWEVARFNIPGDRNRFLLDIWSLGIDAIEIEAIDDLEVRFRVPASLRSGIPRLLFAHRGRVVRVSRIDAQPVGNR